MNIDRDQEIAIDTAETEAARLPRQNQIWFQVIKHRQALPPTTPNPFFGVGVVVVVGVAIHTTGTSFWNALVWLVVIVTVVGMVLWEKRRQSQKRDKSVGVTLAPPNSQARIRVCGNHDEVVPLAGLEDVPFEPVIIRRIHLPKSGLWVFGYGLFLGVSLQILVSKIFNRELGSAISGASYGLGLCLAWLFAYIRPLYYRIVPGRLDIMGFPLLSSRCKIMRKIDLREAQIRIEFKWQIVEVLLKGCIERIRLFGMDQPHEFVKALLLGAISTYPTPPLPDESLLG